MKVNKFFTNLRAILLFAIAGCLLNASSSSIFGQQYEGSPVTKDGLVKVLRSRQFQSRQVVQRINAKGVDFKLDSSNESELVAAGARPDVIEAVRGNYRQAMVASTATKKPVAGNSSGNNNPVKKDKLLAVLKNKSMTNGAILDVVEKNGVDFQTNSAVEKELSVAGASPALITAVKNAYRSDRAVMEPTTTAAVSNTSANRYQSLIDGANESYNRDVNANMPTGSAGKLQAIQMLTEATQLQPNNPVAYQQLGYMTLYGTSNGFTAAENNFKKAIDLGGSAVLRVYHDHNGVFTDTCNGSLYISKDGVRFESDDNKHTFDAKDDDIKQVKTNSSFVKVFQTKAGSYKIILRNGENKNFNFAPLTGSNDESKMVIRLIGK